MYLSMKKMESYYRQVVFLYRVGFSSQSIDLKDLIPSSAINEKNIGKQQNGKV